MCPANTVVIGTELVAASLRVSDGNTHNYLVVPLALRCSSILSSADSSSINSVIGTGEPVSNASFRAFYCPDGNVGFGLKGRAGDFIDALSLGCRPY
jgi:hypothetical protein